MWNPRGGELFYRTASLLVAATLVLGAEPRVARRDTLPFRMSRSLPNPWAGYDVSRDGQRFLMVKAANDQPIVIIGWLDEVREMLKAPR